MINFTKIKSASDVMKLISDIKFRYVKYKLHHDFRYNTRIVLDGNVHSLFNKVIIYDENMVEFSWDYHPDVTKYLIRFVKKLNSIDFYKEYKNMIYKNYNKVKTNFIKNKIIPNNPFFANVSTPPVKHGITNEQIVDVLSELFSADYLVKIFGSAWNIEDVKTKYLNNSSDGGEGWISPVIRLNEVFDGYSVAATVSPVDNTIKVNLQVHNQNYVYSSPILEFCLNYFYMYRSESSFKRDELYCHLPHHENESYVHVINAIFSAYMQHADTSKRVKDSGLKQRRFIEMLFPYLIIFGGIDTKGKHLIDSNSEITKEYGKLSQYNFKYYNISRIFSTPLEDIEISSGVVNRINYHGEVEQLSNVLLSHISSKYSFWDFK